MDRQCPKCGSKKIKEKREEIREYICTECKYISNEDKFIPEYHRAWASRKECAKRMRNHRYPVYDDDYDDELHGEIDHEYFKKELDAMSEPFH